MQEMEQGSFKGDIPELPVWWRRLLSKINRNPLAVSVVMGLMATGASVWISSSQMDVAMKGISASYDVANYNKKSESLKELLQSDSDFSYYASRATSYRLVLIGTIATCPKGPAPCDFEKIKNVMMERNQVLDSLEDSSRKLAVSIDSSAHLWKVDLDALKRQAQGFVSEQRFHQTQLRLLLTKGVTRDEFKKILENLDDSDALNNAQHVSKVLESLDTGYFNTAFETRKSLSEEMAQLTSAQR